MRLNRTSIWQVMTIGICPELPMFNFEILDLLCAWIGLSCEKLWTFEFFETISFSFSSVSIYYCPESNIRIKGYGCLNLPCTLMSNFERLDMFCTWIEHPSEKLWPFEFLESLCCSISSTSIYYVPESDIREKTCDNLNFYTASVFQFQASRYIMRLNRTSEWKVMTIWISWELPLFNFKCLGMLHHWIGHPNEKLWPFVFLESFRCSISSV